MFSSLSRVCRLRTDRPTRRYGPAIERLPSPPMLDFRILGPLEVVTEAGPVRLGQLQKIMKYRAAP